MRVRGLGHIRDDPGCLYPELTKELSKRLSETSKMELELLHKFLSSKEVISIAWG
jgi:hypothetical protein